MEYIPPKSEFSKGIWKKKSIKLFTKSRNQRRIGIFETQRRSVLKQFKEISISKFKS